MNIAVLGYGTIGSGVFELVENDAEHDLHISHVLDIRDLSKTPAADFVTGSIEDITHDPGTGIVVETMGGEHPAFEFVRSCIEAGKHVVTSNKNLVAAYGAQLMDLAAHKGVHFLFEAAVGGAIPVIRVLTGSLPGEKITKIRGILNGTTNFILTRMGETGEDYAAALKLAQSLGYAEADPSSDVEGLDACRKIAILSSIISGRTVDYMTVPTVGITGITAEDIAKAKKEGKQIKLIASAELKNEKLTVSVGPQTVGSEDVLSMITDSYNAVELTGDACEKLVLTGRGAGKLPTASAVLGDIIEAASLPARKKPLWK